MYTIFHSYYISSWLGEINDSLLQQLWYIILYAYMHTYMRNDTFLVSLCRSRKYYSTNALAFIATLAVHDAINHGCIQARSSRQSTLSREDKLDPFWVNYVPANPLAFKVMKLRARDEAICHCYKRVDAVSNVINKGGRISDRLGLHCLFLNVSWVQFWTLHREISVSMGIDSEYFSMNKLNDYSRTYLFVDAFIAGRWSRSRIKLYFSWQASQFNAPRIMNWKLTGIAENM